MSYLYAKYADTTMFEIGNEPEFGTQGDLSITQQVNFVLIGTSAIHVGVKASIQKDAFILGCVTNSPDYANAMANQCARALDAISVHTYENPEDWNELARRLM
jgi:hypothetical protein